MVPPRADDCHLPLAFIDRLRESMAVSDDLRRRCEAHVRQVLPGSAAGHLATERMGHHMVGFSEPTPAEAGAALMDWFEQHIDTQGALIWRAVPMVLMYGGQYVASARFSIVSEEALT